MKNTFLWMAGMLLSVVLGFTSCANNDNAAEPEPIQPVVEQTVGQWLKAMPGVTGVTERQGTTGNGLTDNFYYFYFDQLIDHRHPEKGTFRQKAVLRYVGPNAPTVLHTQGYATNDMVSNLLPPMLVSILKANMIELEYRYFGDSQPQPLDNVDFTYLDSEQASDDLHALVTAFKATGRFPGKWISAGLSKNGHTTAMYAYYSSKKGYDDIDLYVPVAAPFNVALCDPRPGIYLVENSTAFDPLAKKKLKAFGRAICNDTPLSKRLIASYRAEKPEKVKELRGRGMSEQQIDQYAIANSSFNYQYHLLGKLMYVPIARWSDLIPDTTGQTQLDFAEKFIKMDEDAWQDYIEKQKKTATRAPYSQEELLKRRKEEPMFPYEVQVSKEMGLISFAFDYLKGCPLFSADYTNEIYDEECSAIEKMQVYNSQYSNAQVLDFLDNFLPTTTKKMVFVYGEQDPWTGSAIPDPTNPNIRKIIVPKGCHNDYFNYTNYCPVETYNEIMRAVREAIE